jgi:hypothetical protein
MQEDDPNQQQLRVMIQGPEQEDPVAARDNHTVSIRGEDGDIGHDNTTFTMSIDSSPSPSKDSLRDDPESTRLALPLAGPVGEDPYDEEEDAKDVELPKIQHKAARAVKTTSEAISAANVNDMDGGDTNIKKMRMTGWKICTVLTCFALVLIAAAVFVTMVHGTREGKPRASQQDEDSSQDVSYP